ncbi:MAG TPA: hypothetical protein VMO81_13675 [Aestuariivirgaceae bacterium]|nr:hypothetical protein [Aestuariivirgaceae bacterium]
MTRNTIYTSLCAAAVVAVLSFSPVPVATVQAQDTPCAERTNVVDTLDTQYKESPRAIGLVSQEAVLEIFVSDTGTWTVVVTDPQGVSCVLAAGQSWEEIPLASNAPGA